MRFGIPDFFVTWLYGNARICVDRVLLNLTADIWKDSSYKLKGRFIVWSSEWRKMKLNLNRTELTVKLKASSESNELKRGYWMNLKMNKEICFRYTWNTFKSSDWFWQIKICTTSSFTAVFIGSELLGANLITTFKPKCKNPSLSLNRFTSFVN